MNEKFFMWALGPFIVSLIYFAGFSYLSAYYGFFGISTIEISPPVQFVFSHAFPAIKRTFSEFWFIYLLFIFSSIILYYIITKMAFGNILNYLCVGLSSVLLFVLAYFVGSFSGAEQARENIQNLKVMTTSHDGKITVGKGLLRHIVTTGSITYAMKFQGDGDNFWTIRIPSDKLDLNAVYMD